MKYILELTRENVEQLMRYFDLRPFVMQAAFLLTDVAHRPGYCRLALHEFRGLGDADYEWNAADGLSLRAAAYLNALRIACGMGKSMIYMHSQSGKMCARHDEKMMFRIAYAYIPFGIHASLYLLNGRIRGRIWLPGLKTAPLRIIVK